MSDNTDTSGLPQDADEVLELGAAYRRLRKEGNPSASMWKADFEEAKSALLTTLSNRTPDTDHVDLLDDDGLVDDEGD